jgi:hypothetical protein
MKCSVAVGIFTKKIGQNSSPCKLFFKIDRYCHIQRLVSWISISTIEAISPKSLCQRQRQPDSSKTKKPYYQIRADEKKGATLTGLGIWDLGRHKFCCHDLLFTACHYSNSYQSTILFLWTCKKNYLFYQSIYYPLRLLKKSSGHRLR